MAMRAAHGGNNRLIERRKKFDSAIFRGAQLACGGIFRGKFAAISYWLSGSADLPADALATSSPQCGFASTVTPKISLAKATSVRPCRWLWRLPARFGADFSCAKCDNHAAEIETK